jgi:alkanesulfonate monooxygenase SsuD/methylene tetrahydromethanopterin reductase-like flavin-dependent oxidoreductase (luciferase family)
MHQGSRRPLQVGLLLPVVEGMMVGATPRWTDIRAFARTAEAAGFDSVWVIDHLLFPPQGERVEPVGLWEGWSTLAALAEATTQITLGTFVVCTAFRNPALLAKMADTVDEISGGRLILGLGAGNTEAEFRSFGYPFDRRVSRFAEALAIIHALLRTGSVDFVGDYYQARACELRPRGPRPGGPPLMIGTTGVRGLRLAARYADIWNVSWGWARNSVEGAAALLPTVDAACTAVGRDPTTLARSVGLLVELPGAVPYPLGYPAWNLGQGGQVLTGTTEELAETFRGFAALGVNHLHIWLNPMTVDGVKRLADVLRLLDRGWRREGESSSP